MTSQHTLTAIAFATMIVLTGCSSPEATFDPESVAEVPAEAPSDVGPAEEPELIDACAALAGIDIDALMGEDMGEPSDSGGSCRIKAASGMSPATLHVQAFEDGTGSYANQKSLLTVTEELASPGDEAFLGDTALAMGLDVLAGGHHLSVRIHRQSSPITRDDLVTVAETALANLGW